MSFTVYIVSLYFLIKIDIIKICHKIKKYDIIKIHRYLLYN